MKTKRVHNLQRLLDESLESYYWIGFLMADGTVNEKFRLKLALSYKDENHLLKFSEYVGTTNNIKKERFGVSWDIQDKNIVRNVVERYNLLSRKTYNPPDLNYLEGNKFIAFLIGFIDGDGAIKKQYKREDCLIVIKLHSSWLSNLQYISNKLCLILNLKPNKAIVNNQGYAHLAFSNSIICKFLKSKVIEFKLPVLDRKWDLINLNLKNKNATFKEKKENILRLLNDKLTNKEIINLCNVEQSFFYKILREYRRVV